MWLLVALDHQVNTHAMLKSLLAAAILVASIPVTDPGTVDPRKEARTLKFPKHLKENYMYIPAGEVFVSGERYTVEAFYMFRYEVSNLHYREFLATVSGFDEEMTSKMAVETTAWRVMGSHVEPYVDLYHTHPAYDDYPVVNVNHEAARQYCAWLEQKLNENPDALYTVEVSLPTHKQWVRAARAGHINARYSWGGYYLRNSKGCMLANFNNIGAESIRRNGETGDLEVVSADNFPKEPMITAPVASYFPSDFGLYNMNGNVAEMLLEEGIAAGGSWYSTGYDIRNESVMNYDGPSPFVGFRPSSQNHTKSQPIVFSDYRSQIPYRVPTRSGRASGLPTTNAPYARYFCTASTNFSISDVLPMLIRICDLVMLGHFVMRMPCSLSLSTTSGTKCSARA